MTTAVMIRKLRGIARSRRMQILNHQELALLAEVADRMEEQEERIALMSEGREATEEQLRFPPRPRVLALREIECDTVYWVEYAHTVVRFPVAFKVYHMDELGNYFIAYHSPEHYDEADYGITWRLWDALPDIQDMEVAEWAS